MDRDNTRILQTELQIHAKYLLYFQTKVYVSIETLLYNKILELFILFGKEMLKGYNYYLCVLNKMQIKP